MTDILDQIYDTQVDQEALRKIDGYKLHKEQAFEKYQKLKNQLSEEQVIILDRILDANLELPTDELKQNFKNGFKLGIKFMHEVLE